jgi:hypothetical protein
MSAIIDVRRGPQMFDKLLLPRCAVCNRMVDRLTRHHDNLTCRIVFVAHCHGETEETFANDEELYQWSRSEGAIQFGDAFTSKALLGPGSSLELASTARVAGNDGEEP